MLFGTNGIRGIVNRELTPNFCMELAQAFGSLYGMEVAIGSDARLSSEMLKKACTAGLQSVGCDVVDLGCAPTPAIQHFVGASPATGGLIITASHNPPEFNGLKTLGSGGIEISKDEEAKIEALYRSIAGKLSLFSVQDSIELANWKTTGRFTAADPLRGYIDGIKRLIDAKLVKSKKLRVALDCANGVGAITTPLLLRELGCKVVTLNGNLDGAFPGRNAEPIGANIQDLLSFMKGGDFDLGIAHDGDADRAVFVTEKGEFIEGDYSLAIFAREALSNTRGGSIIPTGVNTSSVLWDVAREYGGEVKMMKVGPMAIAKEMMESDSSIGGEGNGGVIFPDFQYCRDGGMASARMVEIVARYGAISEVLREFPIYHMSKQKIACPDKLKSYVVTRGVDHFRAEGIDCATIDGIKANLDNGWVLIRASGTEAIVRVEGESKDADTVRKITSLYIDKVGDWIEEGRDGKS